MSSTQMAGIETIWELHTLPVMPDSHHYMSNLETVIVTSQDTRKSHMWQSRVEIEHYFVAYFNCITAFEVL